MSPSNVGPKLALDHFRDYLLVLARVQFDVRFQGKIDPADIVQETLLKAHLSRDQFQGRSEAELASWLRKVLANTLTDAVRKFTARARDVGLELSLEASLEESSQRLERWLGNENSTPSQQAERHERLLHLAGALAQLPDDQRQALELKHLEGWSVQAISQHLGKREAAG